MVTGARVLGAALPRSYRYRLCGPSRRNDAMMARHTCRANGHTDGYYTQHCALYYDTDGYYTQHCALYDTDGYYCTTLCTVL